MIEMLKRYPEIAEELIVRSKMEMPIVLKTDCNNEVNEDFPIYPRIKEMCQYYCVDNDQSFVDRAKQKYPEMRIWPDDIRRLMFESATFDIVMDFSTIDHVEEYTLVLDQYRRVLRSNGFISIVVWVDQEFHHTPSDINSGQYYFPEREFSMDFSRRFRTIGFENMTHNDNWPKLVRYIGRS